MWETVEAEGLTLVRCRALLGAGGLAHAFSTRRADGRSDFDMGSADDDAPGLRRRRERFLHAAGIDGRRPSLLRQVHGNGIVRAPSSGPPPEGDAALWVPGAGIPSVRTADCVPILVADRRGRAAVAIHAGWRGTVAGVARAGVASMRSLGVDPADLVAALGPAIGGCCYEVGAEVAEAVLGAAAGIPEVILPQTSGRNPKADLRAANAGQLVASGVPAAAVHTAPWCTRCRADLFHSFRRDGTAAGRLMASIGPARP